MPLKFLFLPEMGLLGSQASTRKKVGRNSLTRGLFFVVNVLRYFGRYASELGKIEPQLMNSPFSSKVVS